MRTEDHPVDYGSFEGVIPEGEYGGGTVLLWDRGTWEPVGDPRKGLATGKLEFVLHGTKLRGRWTLVQIRGRERRDAGKAWLLIKGRDETARPSADYDITAALPESVATDRTLDQISRERDRVWHSNKPVKAAAARRSVRPKVARRVEASALTGARRARLPSFMAPQLATLVAAPPEGDEWLHEMKFDGYRVLCRIERGAARLLSRNGKDWTARLPGIARAAGRLGVRDAMLDGEAAVVLPSGVTSFNALQNALGGESADEPVYFVFDLLHLDGSDLTRTPLEERKEALRALLDATGADSTLRYSDHVTGNGATFLRHACRMALEGVVSKRRDAPYVSGRGRGVAEGQVHPGAGVRRRRLHRPGGQAQRHRRAAPRGARCRRQAGLRRQGRHGLLQPGRGGAARSSRRARDGRVAVRDANSRRGTNALGAPRAGR